MIDVDGKPCRVIGTEEHFVLPEYIDATARIGIGSWRDFDLEDLRYILHSTHGRFLHDRLKEVGDGRIAAMDEAGVDMQVLSHMAPGPQIFEPSVAVPMAQSLNDQLAEIVKRYPKRFAGLLSVAPQVPAQAAKEIERGVRTLKLHGVVINSHTDGEYLDDPKFWEILEACEALDAAIYLHPRNPPMEYRALLQNHAGEKILATAIWGFGMEASLHAMRLIVSGVFDRFPNLKFVLGHMGEALPFWLYRLDYMYERGYRSKGKGHAKLLPSEYYNRNFFTTISGICDHPLCPPVLAACRTVISPDRILFAADHPFQSMKDATKVFSAATFSAEDKAKIAHANSERIFHIPA